MSSAWSASAGLRPRLTPRPGALPLDPTECFALRLTLWPLLSSLVFVQKFKFILMKMHKNCWHQSCSFWLRYAPNYLSAGALPQTQLWKLTVLPRRPSWFRGWAPWGKGRREGKGKGGEGVPECPNSELASLGWKDSSAETSSWSRLSTRTRLKSVNIFMPVPP